MAVFNIKRAAQGQSNSLFHGSSRVVEDVKGYATSIFGSLDNTLIIGQREDTVQSVWSKAVGQFSKGYLDKQIDKFANNVEDDANAGVEIDDAFFYQGELTVSLTTNPVQKGADINDHRIKQPQRLTIEVGVSNDVLKSGWVNNLRKVFGNTLNSWLGTNFDDRRIQTFEGFKKLMYEGKPFTVVTPVGVYENMLLIGIRPRTTEENIGLFQGTLEFQEVILFNKKGDISNPQKKTILGTLENKLKRIFGDNKETATPKKA